jgi:uncharacterized membrane protein YkoI
MHRQRILWGCFLLIAGLANSSFAQGKPIKVTEEKPGLLKQAKVTPETATATAQAKFPTGTIKSGELEKEDGKLIYSFDIQLPGVKGTEELHVDAATGVVIKTEHEAPPKPKPAKKPPMS